MRISKVGLMSLFMLGTMGMFVACGGGDNSNDPTSPTTINVAGTWELAGTVTSNNCDYLPSYPDFLVGTACEETIVVTQDGTNLTAVNGTGQLNFSGTLDGKSFTLTQTNPQTLDINGCPVLMTGNIAVTTTTETSGTGSSNVSGSSNCLHACLASCSGTWTKTAGAKYAPQNSLLSLIQ